MLLRKRDKRLGIYFFLPSGIVIVGIIVYPLLFSLVTSFTTYGFLNPFFNMFVVPQPVEGSYESEQDEKEIHSSSYWLGQFKDELKKCL